MINKHAAAMIYKIFFALLGFSALATEVATLVERDVFSPVNFFSYFTVLTNVLVVVTFLASAIALAHGKRYALSTLRSAVTVYILVVGIGFAVLLSGLDGITFTAVAWDNTVLHYLIPLAVLVDYILDRPLKTKFTTALLWLAFPLVYLVYTLIRGSIIGWYPYPFLDPTLHGYGPVVIGISGIVALSVALTWLVVYFAKVEPKVQLKTGTKTAARKK